MTLLHKSWMRPCDKIVTAAAVLSQIYSNSIEQETNVITLHEIANRMGVDITNKEIHSFILKSLKDFEEHYEIAKTPYGYIRWNDDVSFHQQMGSYFYYYPDAANTNYKEAPQVDLIIKKNERFYLPNIEHSKCPENSTIFKKVYGFMGRYHSTYIHHEFAYRINDGPLISVDYWYYSGHN